MQCLRLKPHQPAEFGGGRVAQEGTGTAVQNSSPPALLGVRRTAEGGEDAPVKTLPPAAVDPRADGAAPDRGYRVFHTDDAGLLGE
jgi:hypothetical protein